MADIVEEAHSYSFDANRDDRKTAAIAAARGKPDQGTRVTRFQHARDVLRSPAMKQAGGGAEFFDISDPERAPVFFLDGPDQRRSALRSPGSSRRAPSLPATPRSWIA